MFFDSLKAFIQSYQIDRQVQSTKSLKQVTWSQASIFFPRDWIWRKKHQVLVEKVWTSGIFL